MINDDYPDIDGSPTGHSPHSGKRFLCVSLERRERTVDGITVLPILDFLGSLWGDEFAG